MRGQSLSEWTEMMAREPNFLDWTDAMFRRAMNNRWGFTLTSEVEEREVARWRAARSQGEKP